MHDDGSQTHSFSSRDRTTTETDEAAIAADAIHGCSVKPTDLNTPANHKHTPTLQ